MPKPASSQSPQFLVLAVVVGTQAGRASGASSGRFLRSPRTNRRMRTGDQRRGQVGGSSGSCANTEFKALTMGWGRTPVLWGERIRHNLAPGGRRWAKPAPEEPRRSGRVLDVPDAHSPPSLDQDQLGTTSARWVRPPGDPAGLQQYQVVWRILW